jgi:hypothetical protein
VTDVDVEPEELRGGVCSRTDCPVNDGGECAAGHEDPIDCDDYELTDIDETEPEQTGPKQWSLPDGEALALADLEAATAEYPVSTVAPLGIVAAGKTTLICLMFDQVRTRREPAWKFTRSRTVLGFARRNHDASFNSGRTVPTAARTALSASGLNLHLGMRRAADDAPASIIFIDLSGEHVQHFVSGKNVEQVDIAFRRADHIPIVINGADIADSKNRQKAIMQGRSLLARLSTVTLRPTAVVSIVITKADLLDGVDLDPIFDKITAEHPIPPERRFTTADRGEIVERGHGVHELLTHLTTVPVRPVPGWPTPPAPAPSPLLVRLWGPRD